MNDLKGIREKALINVKKTIDHHKEKIEEAYKWLMRLEYKAQKEGLLTLEYDVGFLPPNLPLCDSITEMVKMICDGTDPDFLAELMTIKFIAGNYTGIEAILYFLYARSMLMIQAGTDSQQIENLFNAVTCETEMKFQKRCQTWKNKISKVILWKNVMTDREKLLLNDISQLLNGLTKNELRIVTGSNGFYEFDKLLPYLDKNVQNLIKQYMNNYRYCTIMEMPQLVQEQELQELENELKRMVINLRKKETSPGKLDVILKCTDKEIQELFHSIDPHIIAVALKGEKEKVTEYVYRNLPTRLRYIVQEEIEYMGPVRASDVESAQEKIIQCMKTANRS